MSQMRQKWCIAKHGCYLTEDAFYSSTVNPKRDFSNAKIASSDWNLVGSYLTVAVCFSMSVDTSATPGSSFSCFSTASVHEVPQTIPSTKKVTEPVAATEFEVFAVVVVPGESQPLRQQNPIVIIDATINVGMD